MANHRRQGVDLERYHARKLRPHAISGQYVPEGGSSSKPQILTQGEYHRKLKMRGTSRSSSKSKAGETKAKASGSIIHYRPVRCTGRPNSGDDARRRLREARRKAAIVS